MTNPFAHRVPSADQIPVIEATRAAYKNLYDHLLTLPEGPYLGLAVTALEQSAMWAIKEIVFQPAEEFEDYCKKLAGQIAAVLSPTIPPAEA